MKTTTNDDPVLSAGHEPTAVDLFSGCGGLTLGLKQAGFHVLGAVDSDPLSNETYALNHPEVRLWKQDIRLLPASGLMQELGLMPGQLDLLAGCPPCQGFSALRTLNGSRSISDKRNELVFDFLRFVCELLPRAVMMENVPGLAHDTRFRKLVRGLTNAGYAIVHDILDTADFDVPQRRRRLILLGTRAAKPEFAPRVAGRRTVRDAIGHLPPAGASGDQLHDLPEARSPKVQGLIARIPRDGGCRLDLPPDQQLSCHKRSTGFKDVYGRLKWDRVSPTITTGCYNPSKGRFLHPVEDRAITLREAACLQGFPTDYRISLRRGKAPAASLIGNALPPEFVRRHAVQLAICLGIRSPGEFDASARPGA